MNVLIDSNIVIDVLIKREPFVERSQLVLFASEGKRICGYVSAAAVTDIFYITNKYIKDRTVTYELVKNYFLRMVNIAAVDANTITQALDVAWNDFEDCVQYIVGEAIHADYIVTRNPKDFLRGSIAAVSPQELLDMIAPE